MINYSQTYRNNNLQYEIQQNVLRAKNWRLSPYSIKCLVFNYLSTSGDFSSGMDRVSCSQDFSLHRNAEIPQHVIDKVTLFKSS